MCILICTLKYYGCKISVYYVYIKYKKNLLVFLLNINRCFKIFKMYKTLTEKVKYNIVYLIIIL